MERAMSTKNLDGISLRPRSASRWGLFRNRIVEWRRRSRSRHELRHLGEAGLHDIGLSRCDAAAEVSKPFWIG